MSPRVWVLAALAAMSLACAENRDFEEQAWDPEPLYPTEAIPRGEVDREIVVNPDAHDEEEAPPPAFERPGVPSGVPSLGPEPEDVYD